MGEIKSAWEIAMEKVGKLKELTPDELNEREKKRYASIGKALADRYIRALNLGQLEIELGKYSDVERELLSSIVASSLFSAIELGDYEKLEKVVRGISCLKQKELPEELVEEIKTLFREFNEARKKAIEVIETSANDILLQFGISGSAIAEINIKRVAEPHQMLDRIDQPFNERLDRLKQKLLRNPV